MSRSVVDTERIAAAAADINRLADTITSSTSELRGRLAGMGADWQGPAKVTRSALQNAASIAALFLTTEAVIADKPEKAAPAMPGGDDMGGMGF